MSWRDNLQDASFRGIPFKVEKSNVQIGRRIKSQDRWQKRTLTIDEGPILPHFSITGYVIQNTENDMDYFGERDELIKALSDDYTKNEKGDKYNTGILIHPFLGRLKVHPGTCSINEEFKNGGMCTFEMEFFLEEDELFPADKRDAVQQMDLQATWANNLTIDNILSEFGRAKGFVENLGQDLVAGMMKVQRVVNGVNNVLRSALTTVNGVIQESINLVESVLDSPCDLYNTVSSATESFKYLVGMGGTIIQGGIIGGCSGQVRGEQIILDGTSINPDLGISIIQQMIEATNFDESNLGTTTTEQENNRALCIDMLKYQLLSFACRVFVRISFNSQQSLLTALSSLIESIENFQRRLGEQTTLEIADIYTAIESMKTLLYSLMMEKVSGLDKETEYTSPPDGISTLELSYNLFKDVERCGEIFDMNIIDVRHPGFIAGNKTIKVLTA